MFKKKILVLLSSLMLVSTFGTSVFADEPDVQDTNLSYEVTEGYEWSVPDSIDFTSDSFEGISATGNDSQVKITKAIIKNDSKLFISVDKSNDFYLEDKTGHKIHYYIQSEEKDADNYENKTLYYGQPIIVYEAGESYEDACKTINATLIKDDIERAGDYTDTLVFKAEISNKPEIYLTSLVSMPQGIGAAAGSKNVINVAMTPSMPNGMNYQYVKTGYLYSMTSSFVKKSVSELDNALQFATLNKETGNTTLKTSVKMAQEFTSLDTNIVRTSTETHEDSYAVYRGYMLYKTSDGFEVAYSPVYKFTYNNIQKLHRVE